MEELKNKTAMQKTQVFNVIILDRSGSMQNIRQAAVDGFNETLAGIKKAQEKFADTVAARLAMSLTKSQLTKHILLA